jgi:hypothetical protein
MIFPYFIALTAISAILLMRRPAIRDVILMGAFLYLGIRARRNLAPLAIVAVPIISRWLGQGRVALPAARWFKTHLTWTTTAASILCVAFLGYDLSLANGSIYRAMGTNRRFGAGVGEGGFPIGSTEFLREHHVAGPIFNIFSSGGYLTYHYPEEKVFIDGRLEVHSTDHYARYLALLSNEQQWKETDERYHFNALILSYPEAPEFTYKRLADPTWAPVELDGSGIVLLRDVPANQDLISRTRLTRESLVQGFPAVRPDEITALRPVRAGSPVARIFRSEPVPWSDLYLGQFFGMIQMNDLAAGQYLRAVRRAPHDFNGWMLLAGSLAKSGEKDLAREVLDRASPLANNAARKASVEQIRTETTPR